MRLGLHQQAIEHEEACEVICRPACTPSHWPGSRLSGCWWLTMHRCAAGRAPGTAPTTLSEDGRVLSPYTVQHPMSACTASA